MAEQPITDVWSSVLERLREDESVSPMLHGFINLIEPKGIVAGTFYLEVPNDFTASMLTQRMRPQLLTAMTHIEEPSPVSTFYVVVNPELETAAPQPEEDLEPSVAPPAVFDQVSDRASESRLNPKYTFDSFVIGQSNRFAHAAAVAVAEAPAKAYNPLFIYGESGLGKTHLLHAIGHYAMSLFPGIRVRYVSSEEFTNDFINSIANNRGAQFQQRYRSVD